MDFHDEIKRITRFSPSDGTPFNRQIELNTKNSTKRQQSCRLVEFLVFNSAFGRSSLRNSAYDNHKCIHDAVECILDGLPMPEHPRCTDDDVIGTAL